MKETRDRLKSIEERRAFIGKMLNTCLDPNRTLTKWENIFLASVYTQWDRKGDLSDKQFDVLETIYSEKTA